MLSSQFPVQPPKGYFLTKIFHPNVSEAGDICVSTLKKDWNQAKWSFINIFEVIKCLLIVPFPESSLNEEAGKLFMEDYEAFKTEAEMVTQCHARPAGHPLFNYHQEQKGSEAKEERKESSSSSRVEEENKCETSEIVVVKKQTLDNAEGLLGSGR